MNPRTTRLLLIFSAFIAGLLLCFSVVLLVADRGRAPIIAAPSTVGGPFKLTDQNGHEFTDTDLKGQPFLVFFGYTHCPDVCPTTMFEVSEVLRALGPDADRTKALGWQGQVAIGHAFCLGDIEEAHLGRLTDQLVEQKIAIASNGPGGGRPSPPVPRLRQAGVTVCCSTCCGACCGGCGGFIVMKRLPPSR